MRFRPCIDIHKGKVKQIIGGSLNDKTGEAVNNFVADRGAAYYASLFEKLKLQGGHVIMLDNPASEYYHETRLEAVMALNRYPMGLQVGGGINPDNAVDYLNENASHVIVSSYVFNDGKIDYANLCRMRDAAGKKNIVLDLSCRKREGRYYVVTDRWQKFTDEAVSADLIYKLSDYCDEFLIHAVDVEGKISGIDAEVVGILGGLDRDITVTYAGGISGYEDIDRLMNIAGKNAKNVDFTVGSALDIYGGTLSIEKLAGYR